MKQYITAGLTGAVVLVAACQDNTTAPSRDRVVAGSQQTLQSLATGVMATDRVAVGGGYYTTGAIMARDVIVPTGNETRNLTEYYEVKPDPSDFIGGSQWPNYYITIRAAHNLMADAAVTGLGAGDKAATTGFLRTLIALEYIRIIEYRDQNGVVIQGADPSVVDPIRTKQSGLTYVSALLDSALTDLNAATTAGTTALPFTVPPGYQLHGDYSLVSNLVLLNRGLKGKAETFRALDAANPNAASAATAITALTAALADAPGTPTKDYLNKGLWFQYNPASPESFGNPLPSATNLLTDNFVNSIQPGDARKANIVATARQTVRDSAYTGGFRNPITDPTNAANQSAPLPAVRNAEFYLLRAQDEIAIGNLPAATADINVVHTVEGGLPAYSTFTSAASAIAAVLYEYRYSFIYNGPQHLDALREYNMINQAYVSQPGIPTPGPAKDALVQSLPITQNESNARNGNITPVP
jgi:starch-binding outer membrane protein, SusD/RagB family